MIDVDHFKVAREPMNELTIRDHYLEEVHAARAEEDFEQSAAGAPHATGNGVCEQTKRAG